MHVRIISYNCIDHQRPGMAVGRSHQLNGRCFPGTELLKSGRYGFATHLSQEFPTLHFEVHQVPGRADGVGPGLTYVISLPASACVGALQR
eukprot:937912-Rhodomonas_salina.1